MGVQYKTRNGAQRRRYTSKAADKLRKIGNNYGIGLGLGFWFSDTQRNYGAVVRRRVSCGRCKWVTEIT